LGNGTDIIRLSFRINRSPFDGYVVNVQWDEVVLYSKIIHSSFNIAENNLLIVGCSTCETWAGRIQIYNIDTTINTTTEVNNMTKLIEIKGNSSRGITYLGERFFFEKLNSARYRLIYTSRPTMVST
jgi:hypothetical protein